jgi:hypothetical protein
MLIPDSIVCCMATNARAWVTFGVIVPVLLSAMSGTRAEETVNAHPLEPAATASPRDTLKSFLETAHEGYVLVKDRGWRRGVMSGREQESYRDRQFGCLDLSEVPPTLKVSPA